jgi:hypothetical protein
VYIHKKRLIMSVSFPSIWTGKRGEALAEALPALLYFEGSLIFLIPGFPDL